MKVLLFTNLFPSESEPTRGLFNLRRFQALAKHCSVRVVAPFPAWRRVPEPSKLFHIPYEVHEGLDVTYPTYWAVPRLKRDWHAALMYRSVRSHIRSIRKYFDFDVVLGAFAYPDVVAADRLAEDTGCPFVAVVMGSDMNVLATRPPLRRLIRSSLMRAAKVIALSTALKERLTELDVPSSRIIVQQNGVDGQRFFVRDKGEARHVLGLPQGHPIACFIGHMVEEKGADVLIDAMDDHSGALRELNVIFIGDGELTHHLKQRVAQLGLSAKVRFMGRQTPDTIPLWISAADMLCLPSRREGCPNVVLEALAAGRPVIASRVGGVPELLNNQNGIMVPAGDPSALAFGLAEALQRPWNPAELRASVPSLSWDASGKTFYDSLMSAIRPGVEARLPSSNFDIHTGSCA